MNFLIGCLITFAIIGILIFLLFFAIRHSNFNSKAYGDARNEIFLSFKDFIDFYNLNPDRYEFNYDDDKEVDSLNIKGEYESYEWGCKVTKLKNKYKIKFKFFSYIRFYYWNKHRQKVQKKNKYNEDMRGMLELVQKDINGIRERAEKEVREAEKITNEVGGRCKNATY